MLKTGLKSFFFKPHLSESVQISNALYPHAEPLRFCSQARESHTAQQVKLLAAKSVNMGSIPGPPMC